MQARSCRSSYKIQLLIFFMITLSSCSWVSSSRRSLIGNDPGSTTEKQNFVDNNQTSTSNSVTRTEYEDLLRRYEDLSRKYAQTKESESLAKIEKDKASVDPKDDASAKAQLVETVDVFDKQVAKPESSSSVAELIDNPGLDVALSESTASTEDEIAKIRRARNYLNSKNYDKSMEILQPLEQTKNLQIKVRVKVMIAELLIAQNEYDLALQVYEEVIQKYAFSGYTLEALKGLVICSEKLNMTKKKEQYSSILNDVFGKS